MSDTVIVTGGAGYVGSHTCKALASAGFLPVTLDDLSRGHVRSVRWGPLEQVSLLDREGLARTLAKWRPVAVMHFAALASVPESLLDPAAYWRVNVVGTVELLDAMSRAGVARLVYSSSCAVFGTPDVLPVSELTPQRPTSPYGETKLAAERMLHHFDAAHGLRSVSLRYFNAAGADHDNEIGESHDPETHLIPTAIAAALHGGPALTIHGDDWPTPDGTCIRDYVHVSDLARAHVASLRYLEAGGPSTRINLGTGIGLSVLEVLSAVERAVGVAVPHRVGPRRAGDPAALVADPQQAKLVLGWVPEFTSQIVPTAVAWAKSGQGATDVRRG